MKPSNSCEVSIVLRAYPTVRYGNLMFRVAEACASLLFQQQGFAGLERERGNARGGAGFERLRPEARDVEAEIVLFFGHLDRHGAAARPGQRAAAGEALVGAFKGLDRQDGAVL